MRGKEAKEKTDGCAMGITPAHAGKSFKQFVQAYDEGDHPRTCGEKWYNAAQSWNQMGSPPHMRGKGGDLSGRVSPDRITPAHAGKSESRRA